MRLDRDHAYLLDIQEAAELLVQFTSEQDQSAFLEDRKTQSAVIYQLLLMGGSRQAPILGFAHTSPGNPLATDCRNA